MKISKDVHYLSLEERKQDWLNKCKTKFGNQFDYSEVDYVNSVTKVRIYCRKCNTWSEITSRGHLKSPYGCTNCAKMANTSSGENLVSLCLEKIQKEENIKFEITPEYSVLGLIQGRHTKRVKIDFRIITEDGREFWTEYNGEYHYLGRNMSKNWEEEFMCQLERDINVKQYCNNSNGKITLIELPYMYYSDLDSIEHVLRKILLEGAKPEDVIKQPIINFVDTNKGDNKTKIETINKLISIRNNILNKEEWGEILSSVNTVLGQERAYTNITIAKILFQYFHVGDLILHRDIREKLREIYTSINYSKIPKATNLKEFFEIRRNSMTFKDGSKPAAFRIMSVKPEYQEIYDSINPKEEKGSE